MAELFPAPGRRPSRDALDELRHLMGAGAEEELVDVPGPTHWPEVGSADLAAEWEDLRGWVVELCERFPSLDHHVVPRCWWRHNDHVEAIVALRDHERASFGADAPPTAPLDWFRALRDISSLLRTWTAELGCGVSHQDQSTTPRPVDGDEWRRFVAKECAAREAKEVERAVR